jgi:hypothetical protein
MSIDEQVPTPHEDDPTVVAMAQAIGAQLRALPADDVRALHVRRAAAEAGAPSDRAPADVLGAATTAPARGPAGPGTGALGRPRTRTVRRLLPASALALVAVLAVVTWATQPSRDLPVIALGGAGAPMDAQADKSLSREAAVASDAPMTSMMWIAVDYEFILEDGARLAAGTGPAWRFAPPSDASAAAALLTSRFGLPTAVPSEWDPSTLVAQSADGASVTLMPTGDWYFGAAPDERMQWRCPEILPEARPDAPAQDGELTILPADGYECQPPPPATGVPTAAEARSLAIALFEGLGITGVRLEEPYVDEWSASVWGLVAVDGAPSDLGLYVGAGFGGDGRLQFANGSFARPVALGDYPTVSSEDALERLRAQLDPDLDAGGPVARPYPADIAPEGESETERQQVTVRLVAVDLVAQFAWTREGEMVLVPHYRFRDADGGEWWVVAIADRYLEG